ncbi:intermembrane lipid transfer protein VPS13B isoform X5 [Passer domesticus]|uniref:intermembrane lipid transfer protein VPS13B isoform X5 n=1 Tax=Passer domesticus TaxID=48849 RepID=UPI0030FF16A2
MLESYVTPILMSYVNRYIKNLKPSDLQLSLWGGDVVLSKLELKLDVLEQELKLPFTFLSGHIHELRIHVPWTKLGSEPVVITINTMECILKLKDGAQQEDHESCGSSSTNRSTTESLKSAVKSRRVQQSASPDPDLPPGYVQSLIRRVVNNVNIVINNLILKYVEDDIVLSVNITSAECYTVDEFWDRAFMDISATDLVLRKMINFSDCTVCLDKRNASGKIEFYQEPLLYKCSFRTRLHFTYDNLNSKMPSIIKIHTLVESLKLSISDQQLPMFIRIMQLGIALYYGEIGNFKDGESEDLICHSKDMLGNITGTEDEASSVMQYPTQYISQDPYFHQDDDQQQGWVSWAWSFVPAIVSYDDEENDSGGTGDGTAEQQKSQSLKDPIISVGFYCTKATVTFKLTEMQAESSYYSPQKVKSKEVICWEQEGTTVEVLMKGELFFDCQIGFVGCQAMCLKGIMGIKDFEENMNRSDEEACFFSCGENLSVKGMTYLTNSLFDYRSPENNSIRAEFILDAAHHKETYTEIAGMQRFGAFYMDYLYTMESTSGKVSGNQQDLSSVKSEDFGNVQEMSTKSLIVGPLNLRLDSSAVHRIMKMIVCALEHEYEPYCKTKPDIMDGSRAMPSSEEVASLEEYIPTRLTTFTILKCTIIIPVAEFNLLDHLLPIIMGEKNLSGLLNAASFQPLRPLPSIRILVDKVNLEHSVPMYAEQLVHVVSSLGQPSDNLLHYCYSHCYLKIFGFQAALTSLDSKGLYCIPVPVIPSFSTAVYGKLIKFPKYWSKRAHVPLTECIFELPNLTVQATRAQTLLLQTIYQSWCHPVGNVSSVVVNEALLNEVFQTSGAVLLSSVQGLAINVDPVLYTWLVYQPQKRVSRHIQQSVGAVPLGVSVTRKKEDEASVGSAPLARQQSNQASEYASSPVKTKTVTESRPLSLPVKTVLNSSENCRSPEERMKEFIGIVWNAVKCLTLQLEVQSCCVFLPNDSLPSPSTIVSGDIPGTVRNWYHGQASMPGTLVVCLPQIKIMSAGHKHMEPLQEIPFVVLRPILEEGDAFPWTISLHHFSVYTLLGQQMTLNLVEPMGCTSTLAVTSQKLLPSGPESRHSFVVCLHVDLESLEIKCSNPQVQLLYELAEITSKVWNKIQRKGVLYQSVSSVYTETVTGPVPPSSPVKSSIGTIPPDTSTYSPSADIGTTTEGDSLQGGDDSPFSDSITLEQTTSNIGVSSGRVSLWMQWMLPKITVKLFAPDPRNNGTEVCIVSELEDLSASVDMQDVYTKIKCKIESFNIDHYRNSLGEDSWSLGQYGGVFLSCTDKLNRRTLLVRPISKQDPFSNFSGFFPSTTAKLLDGSHQQHGFLSLTYTKAVTKNVRHKLISRNERRTFHKVSEGHTDGSPHFLHEILLSAQAFDVVLCFPLLNAIASIFQARLPRSQKEKRKSPGQPMRTHALTSRNLPLIYINTGVIRVFFPKNEEDHHIAEANPSIKEDTLVLKIGSVSMAPQADNPLSRAVLRKDIYQRALNLGILRDPGSEVEDRQYQIDLQSINIGTAYWNQLKPEKENGKGGVLTETERNSQNPALEWNMASSIRRHQERRAILTPILTDFTVRITAAPAIIFTKIDTTENLHTEEILVCGHSLEVNMTTNLDFFLSVAQVQLLQQLVQANMVGLEASSSTTEVSKQEQKKMDVADGGTVETSSRYSGAQDSGIGSDSVKIRIIQIEQHSGTSQHRIARPSRQSSIVKNLNFIPFDIFVTASRISLMTYSCTASPKSKSVQDQKDGEKISKSSLNLPETGSSHDTKKPSQPCISSVTADDLLNSNPPLSAGRKPGLLSLESLHASTRSSARQALGITIVRQPGRRGAGDIELQPFLYLVLSQPSVLLSCHHRKQKVEISVFDAGLKGVASDYKCTDPGKTLPEALDYCKIWLHTVAGEVDAKSGIPPPLITVQIKDFLNGPADINVDISKPLKANLSFARLDQINQFLKKIITTNEDVPRKEAASSAGIIPDEDITLISRHPSTKDFLPAAHTSTVQKASMQENLWQALSCFQKISIHTVQMVVLMETIPHPSKPCLLVSFSNLSGSLNIKSGHKTAGIHGSSLVLDIKDFLLKTSLKERAKSLIGPFCCSVNVEAKWCKHSGDPGPEQSVPKIYIDLRGGLLQVFWGQEHLNCLVLLQELLWQYLSKKGSVETVIAERTHPTCFSAERNPASKPEHTSDDLRTGLFQYIQDAEAQKLPNAYEVVFYNETEDSPGMMLWRYPEPRVLTLVKINPVPFNTTEDPDISTADLGDVLQVPCSLEYWDELQKSFVAFREFSLSESKVCELQLPSVSLVNDQKELIASDLWRIVLNSSQNVADDQSSESESGSQSVCDQLVTPTALAACTRVDSCFTPWFVPSLSVLIQFTCLEVHLCHHLDQLGTAPPKFLQPFLSDKNMPSELEYMIVSFDEPHVYLRQWNDESVFQEMQFSTQADCKLLECRNVTMQSVVKPFKIWGQIAVSSGTAGRLFDCTMMVDPISISFGQYALHSLNTAIQAWQQNRCPEAEEFVFSHFVICNDTQETLRFGQVDTDENILLATLHSHQYSWRSHKSPQLLHICIEGWGNWRWSEPFSVDNTGTFIRTIQYKGRTASLIIKVQQLSGVQKQILICGRQTVCSYLSESIELKVVQHYISQDGQAVVKEHINCLAAKQKLPSYILENNELTELSVKSTGDEDWSQDVCLSSKQTEHSTVIQVPSSKSSITYVWCTVLTLEPNSHVQQRLIVFSPLFIVRSHLPDPIILHIEKRSLGLNETQVIPGKGQEKALQNIEPDLTHHLTFQAREEDDPSECAVPISTTLIKQIATKSNPCGSVSQVLSEFYGIASPPQPAWPYNRKDSDSNEQLSQWDSPMRVKLSVWKPYVRTLLIELLPWALLINQSKWDLWLFEGEKILLQVPSGKVIIPPNFEEAFQVGIYWANTNTVHKSVAIKLVHNVTSPKWKDADNGEVVTLDEEGFVEAEIKLGAFPGHQKLCEFCISSMVRQGIQILQIEDKTTIINDTSYQIYYRPQLVISKSHSGEEDFQCPESAVFSLGPAGAGCGEALGAVPCWDLLWEPGASAAGPCLGQRRLLLALGSAGARPLWSLPAAVSAELARQSVAVPAAAPARSGFCTRAIALTYQEHLGVTYLTLTEDPSPRIIIHNRCSIPLLVKENFKETPKFEVYCRKIPAESSVHHELYHQISSYPDCKTRDLLPSILLKVVSSDELVNEWSDVVDINNQGTQIVFLTGFGCVYVDITHHCGTIVITLAPEGRAGPAGINLNRSQEQTLSLKMFISQLSLAAFDDITNHKVSSELLRLTADNVFLHMAPATSSLLQEFQQDSVEGLPQFHTLQVYCEDLQLDNQLYSKSNFHFAVLLCQEEKTETAQWSRMNNLIVCNKDLESYKENCFIKLCIAFSEEENFMFHVNDLSFELKPARLYVEDTFVYYIKTLFDTYLPENKTAYKSMNASDTTLIVPEQVREHARALVKPVKLRRLKIQPVNLLVSIHASLKLYIASDHTPLSFSEFERGPVFTTARQLVHALAMHYAAGALFRAGWVVGSLEILGSPASLVRSIGNGIADFFRLPYEGLTRGPGAFVSGVSRGTTSFVKHISKGTLTSITNLATSLARNMDRLSLDEEHYNRQEEWRRQLPESLGEGLRQGLSRLGISLLGAIAGIVDQPMRNFQRVSEAQASAGHKARGVISGVGKGIMGVFTKPIGGAAELVSQTGYGILHGAGLSQLPKQRSHPNDQHVEQAPNSHVKYVWKMLQSLGRPEVHMALDVMIVSGSGQQHEGCLLLTSEVLFVVSISEDTQQQAFPVTEIDCLEDDQQKDLLKVQLKQQRVPSDLEAEGARERLSEQQYNRLVEYITKTSCHLAPGPAAAPAPQTLAAEQPLAITKTYQYVVDPNFAQVFISKFTMVKNKALRKGFN